MPSEIHIHLLNNRPRVMLDQQDLHIPDSSMDLLIYLAVENQAQYDRDDLTLRLYESLEFRDSLRKTALSRLPDPIKSLCIRPAPVNILGYDNTHVRVDANEFEKLVKPVAEINSLTTYKLFAPQLLKASELYQDHFLNGYVPTLYGLNHWIQEKRASLRVIFHSLLEKQVQYEIVAGRYDQALIQAERWHQSLPGAELPLQYLIWLATNLDSYTLTLNYFNKLNALDSPELRVIGYKAEEWQRLLTRGLKPDIGVLKLNHVARIEVHELTKIASLQLTGRDRALEAIFETLFVTKSHALLTITGDRGIGKTALADAVALACETAAVVDRIIRVDLTFESDLEQVFNAIATQADKPHLLDLNYRNKYLSIEQLFETENDLLILDQQETSDLFSADFRERIITLSQHVVIVICCHKAWDDVYNIQLDPLDSEAVRNLFIEYGNSKGQEADSDILLTVTGGSPLALKLLMSGMKIRNLNLEEAVKQISEVAITADFTSESTAFRYRLLLHWCWRLLDSPARQILASLQDFDLTEGPSPTELRNLHKDLPDTVFDDALAQLTDLKLLELYQHARDRYSCHSLIHEFLWEINALVFASDDPDFKATIRTRFCEINFDYLAQFAKDYLHLGPRQRNLIRAFNLRFEQDITPEILVGLNQFLPFLIRRGQYQVARRLATQAAEKFIPYQSNEFIQLQLNLAKLDMKQGEFQTAEIRLRDALDFCEIRDETFLLGEIFQQLGIVTQSQGQINQARAYHEKALTYASQHQQHELIATILANLGTASLDQGNYATASEQLAHSLRIAQDIQQLRIIEFTQSALGIVAMQELEFERALEYLTQARATVNHLESPERFAINFMNTGAAYYYLGQYQLAEENLRKGLEIAQKLQYDQLVSYVMRDLGRVQAALGNLLEAEHLYKVILTTAHKLNLVKVANRAVLDMGKLYFQMHLWQMAKKCFQDVLKVPSMFQDLNLLAEALIGLGMSIAAELWLTGNNNVEIAVSGLQGVLDVPFLNQIAKLPLTTTHLRKAEFFFQHGLINFPYLDHYQIPAAWAALLQLEDSQTNNQ